MSSFRTPWRAVAAMFLLNGALFGIWASRIPAIKDLHGLDPATLGLLLLCLAGGAIASFPIAGRLADTHGPARVTRAIAVAYSFALVGLALAPSISSLVLLLILFGATHGAMDVTMNAWAAEVERAAARPIMASFHAMFSLGAGLGAASGYVAVTLGWGLLAHFAFAAAVLAVTTLAIASIVWMSDPSPAQSNAPVFALPKGALLTVGLVAFCASLCEGAMADWSAVFLRLVTSASEANAALGYAVFSTAMVVMRLLGAKAIEQLGSVRTAAIGGVLATIGVLLAVGVGDLVSSLIGFAMMGLGYAVIIPLAISRAANDGTMAQGAAIASIATLGYGGLLLGPPIVGFLAELTSLRAAFLLLAVLSAMIAIFARSLASTPRAHHVASQAAA